MPNLPEVLQIKPKLGTTSNNTHKTVEKFKCSSCTNIYSSQKDLLDHINYSHPSLFNAPQKVRVNCINSIVYKMNEVWFNYHLKIHNIIDLS